MKLGTLLYHWKNTKGLCSEFGSRCKYVVWVCSKKLTLFKKLQLKIKFTLASPVGKVALTVRCNRGSDYFIFSEVFQHRYYDFTLPTTPATVLDLGANIGFTSIYLSRKYPDAEIACVEPMPNNIKLLNTNIIANKANVRVIPKAISIEDGFVSMQKAPMDYGHKIEGIGYGREVGGDVIQVKAVSVSSLMRELGWKRIGLLKVDVEGYEGILLQNKCEWLSCIDSICIECHEGFGVAELKTIAAKYGFFPPEKLPGAYLLVRATI